MIQRLAIANYRSLRQLVVPLSRLNVITGANGSGKTNLYRALRLLADTAQGGVIGSLAREGGLDSTLWAGVEEPSRGMRKGTVPIQRTVPKEPVHLQLGFASELLSYAIDLGMPIGSPGLGDEPSMFSKDPEIKTSRRSTVCSWRFQMRSARRKCSVCATRYALGAFTITSAARHTYAGSLPRWPGCSRCVTDDSRDWRRRCAGCRGGGRLSGRSCHRRWQRRRNANRSCWKRSSVRRGLSGRGCWIDHRGTGQRANPWKLNTVSNHRAW
jgi:energy-coupling factor transporter ATP-binding protein EcfA2